MIFYENLRALNKPFEQDYKDALKDVIDSGWYVLGNHVSTFEKEFATYCNMPYGVGVASGLDALIIGLESLKLPPYSEVIVPANTYIASIQAIIQAGLTPILVEPDPTRYNINAEAIETALTPDTAAIMVVHLYGKVCDMDPILSIAKEKGLAVIEDCAQAHGATYKGRKAGSFGNISAFSFYPTKNLGGMGDGGIILCQDATQQEDLQRRRNYGSAKKYHNDIIGHNSRLDELQAAFLRKKLPHLDTINTHKRNLAAIYREHLPKEVVLPVQEEDFDDVYHIFNIRTPKRDDLRKHLLDNDIRTEIHYPIPPHQQACMPPHYRKLHLPITEAHHKNTLSLPISYAHTAEDIHKTATAIRSFFN